ncbi:uncharacterized protein [Tiliqua scincoides]
MASPLKSSPASPSETETPQLECESPAGEESENHTMVVVKMESPEEEKENVPPSEGGETPVRPVDSQNYVRKLLKMESCDESETPDRPTDSQSLPQAPMKKKQKCRRYEDEEDDVLPFPSLNLVYQFAMEEPPVPRETEAEAIPKKDVNQDAFKTLRNILGVLPLDRQNKNLTSQTRQRITKSVLRASLFTIVKYCVSKFLEVSCDGCQTKAPNQDAHVCLDWTQEFIRDMLRRVMKKLDIRSLLHTCICIAFSLGCLEMKQEFPEYVMSLLDHVYKFESEPHKIAANLLQPQDRVFLFSVERVVKAKSFWFYLM